ncbi:unnamed protein product [Clonostachys rhizophaga]|uniref:Microbial-type PARG catalytic domain-containing protein n=1 Tax=Clonostachys rhizophaga TaxID=160324 RepID=A0A9N9VQE3_9HYPO|nr:unnamed protein product [Clonostachys rhizophaga]
MTSNNQRDHGLIADGEETRQLVPELLAKLGRTRDASSSVRHSTHSLPYLDPNRCPLFPEPATIRVVNEDTLNAALRMSEEAWDDDNANANACSEDDPRPIQRLHPLIVNFANGEKPCGGWLNGKLAQEEAICYRSSLYKSLTSRDYPLSWDNVIYSPYVLVLRQSLADGHRLYKFPPDLLPHVSCLTVAAIRNPRTHTFVLDGERSQGRPREKHIFASDKDRSITKAKMRLTLRAAARHGQQSLVLGALGCGVYGNPAEEVAHCWLEVLRENEFAGNWWKRVWFAVYDPKQDGNFDTFHRVLHGQQV